MKITLRGYLPDHELWILINLLAEHGFDVDIQGYFTDFEFVSEQDLPEEIATLIANTFAPTPAKVLESRAEAERQRQFANYDAHALMYQREVRLGVSGAAEKLAAWDAYAEALRAINDTEGWFRDPQWPVKPEV